MSEYFLSSPRSRDGGVRDGVKSEARVRWRGGFARDGGPVEAEGPRRAVQFDSPTRRVAVLRLMFPDRRSGGSDWLWHALRGGRSRAAGPFFFH